MTANPSAKGLLHTLYASLILLILPLLPLVLVAQPPSGYYNTAIGLTGQDLHIALHNIIKSHDVVSYTPGVWNAFYTTDVRNGDKIWDIYSDIPSGTLPYEYTVGTSQCGTSSQEGDCYSREHSFPSSYFAGASPMYTDIHHIFPVDQYVNAVGHSNYPFSTVASPVYTSLNGSKRGPSSFSGYTGTAFEPIDAYKGDIARAYFYMATRYRDLIHSWSSNNTYADAILNETAYPVFESWFLNLLFTWHTADPVSQKEIDRNNAIYAIQNNRNPFVDHPEYVQQIWYPSGPVTEPTNHISNFASNTSTPPYSSIQLSWTDATGEVLPAGYLLLGSTISAEAIPAPSDGTPISDGLLSKNVSYGTQVFTFTNLSAATNYYFKIFPYTNAGSLIDYKTDGAVPTTSISTTEGASVLQVGDIAIIQYQATNPDGFTFINFTQLAAGTEINFTDNGFTSPTTTRSGEGFLTYTAPALIPAGTVISWVNGMDIIGTGFSSNSPSNFALATSGDQLIAYQGNWNSNPSVIFGINFGNAGWLSSGEASSNTSYLPSALTNNVSAVAVSGSNGYYNQTSNGTRSFLQSLINYPTNWLSSNTVQSLPPFSFTLSANTIVTQSVSLQDIIIHPEETLTIQPNKSLSVLGNIVNDAGTQGLIIASDATGTGMLQHNTQFVPATVQLHIPGNAWDWHLISAPLTQAVDESDFIPFSGYDLYCYHEPNMLWVNYKNTTNSPTFLEINGPNFNPGSGYMVAYQDIATPKQFQGLLNNGTIATELTTAAANADLRGYHLLGNPYPSAIDWKAASGWSRSNLELNAGGYDFWIFNEATGNYGSYNSALSGDLGTNGTSRYIATGQGFIVRAASEGTISMNNNVRSLQNPSFLKADSTQNPLISLRFNAPNGLSDEMMVTFNTSGEVGGTTKLPSLQSLAPNCWAQYGSHRHSIHFAGLPATKTLPIHLKVAVEGQHSIYIPQLHNFPIQSSIKLIDLFTNSIYELTNETSIHFHAHPNDPTARFLLEFGGSIGLQELSKNKLFTASYSNGMLNIHFEQQPESGVVSVYAVNGQLLYQSQLHGAANSYSLSVTLSSGVHIVSYSNERSYERFTLVN